MGFLQGPITDIHRHSSAATRVDPPDSVAVVIPMAARDIETESAQVVLAAASSIDPDRIIIPARGDPEAVSRLDAWATEVAANIDVLWCNAPSVRDICADHGISLMGKGGDVWLALGPAATSAEVVCCIDADVASATPEQLTRLLAPIDGRILATKAWYTRIEDDRLYGRMCRLLVRPLIHALAATYHHPLVAYLQAFRYPLAGEVALHRSIIDDLSVPTGMGLEIGVLGELFTLAGFDATAQVDLGNHRHEHRPVGGTAGLVEIAPQVTGALFDIVHRYVGEPALEELHDAYEHWATRVIDGHASDAALNGLAYDATAERAQVEAYARAVAAPATVEWTPRWADLDLDPETVIDAGQPPELPHTDY